MKLKIFFIGAALLLTSCGGATGYTKPFEVQKTDWVKGSATASVTIIEYADMQCPSCAVYNPLVNQLLQDFAGQIRLVFRHFPLYEIHKNTGLAHRTVEAAGKQGKFWEMKDVLFTRQSEWESLSDPKDTFITYATQLGLNQDQFVKDLGDGGLEDKIKQDRQSGLDVQVYGTPTFFINGLKIQNPESYEAFKKVVQLVIDQAPVVQPQSNTNSLAYHAHVDFKVFLNNQPIDFSVAKYQSTEAVELNPYLHLHDGNGSIMHLHKRGLALKDFFTSLGMEFSKDCFVMDNKQKFCGDAKNTLKFLVNGQANDQFGDYVPTDLDHILISYGPEKATELDLAGQIKAVSNDACIYSEKCPERGKPPTENCVGGLGTDCNE